MKRLLSIIVVVSPVLLAACAEQPLREIVDEHKQQRIREAYADKPLVYGSGDGVGLYSARAKSTLTLADEPALSH